MAITSQSRAGAVLRLVTINIWGTEPPLDRRLALAQRQLRALAPDVVCMQEVKPLDGEDEGEGARTTADVLADALGYERVYEVALRWRGGSGQRPAGEEGLAILSRHPIREHRVLRLPESRPDEARILLSAYIEAPDAPVWCHTTHLHWRLDDGLARERQVVAIDETVRAIAVAEPEGLVQILAGDFNATPAHDEIRFLRGLTTLAGRRTHYQDAFARRHPREEGHTWTMANPTLRGKGSSLDMDRRIDYVFVTTRHKDGRGTVHDARVVLDEQDGGLAASDHYGVLADVQIAPDGLAGAG
jgi:endonuclease/exonuclease/phosphatase family metal-dependent hydrolase